MSHGSAQASPGGCPSGRSWSNTARCSLLRFYPVARSRHLHRTLREPAADGLAGGLSMVIGREEQRPRLLVGSPVGDDLARLRVSPVVKLELLDPVVGADEDRPTVTREVAAAGGVLDDDLPRGTLPQRKLLHHAGILDRRARVPDHVEWEQEPVLVIEEAG